MRARLRAPPSWVKQKLGGKVRRRHPLAVVVFVATIWLMGCPHTFGQAPLPPPEGPNRPEGMGPQGPPPPEMGPEMRERGRGRGMRPGMPDLPPGLKMEGPILSPFEANAVDQARFQIAGILVEQKKYEDAIGELLKTAEESPDPICGAAAHISAGNVFRQGLKETDKAVEQYREVKGKLADLATRYMVETYQEANKPEEAVKLLEDILAKTQDPAQKVRLWNMMAEVYRRSGKADKAIEALRKITESIGYNDAEAMRKGWLVEEAQLDKVEAKIRDLRADGRNEEADRLQREVQEIKERKPMRDALKNQKRAEPPAEGPGVEDKKEKR